MFDGVNLVPRLVSPLPVAAPPFCYDKTLVHYGHVLPKIWEANDSLLQRESLSVTKLF